MELLRWFIQSIWYVFFAGRAECNLLNVFVDCMNELWCKWKENAMNHSWFVLNERVFFFFIMTHSCWTSFLFFISFFSPLSFFLLFYSNMRRDFIFCFYYKIDRFFYFFLSRKKTLLSEIFNSSVDAGQQHRFLTKIQIEHTFKI